MAKKDDQEIIIGAGNYAKEAYGIYGKYTIEDRAVPDFRDGLKPVQRRILYTLYEMKMFPNASFDKSAAVIGPCMGRYHPHGDCLDGNTKIPLLNGACITLEDWYNNHKHEGFWLYSKDKHGCVRPGYAHSVRIGQFTNKVFKIKFNNCTVECTANHPFLLNDGTYAKAEDLKPGDSISSIYFGTNLEGPSDSYQYFVHVKLRKRIEKELNYDGHNVRTVHRWVQREMHPKSDSKLDVHHSDLNWRNNNPSNLEAKTKSEHSTFHNSREHHWWYKLSQFDRDNRLAQGSENRLSEWKDKELNEHQSIVHKEAFRTNDEYKQTTLAALDQGRRTMFAGDPEVRKKMRKKNSQLLKDYNKRQRVDRATKIALRVLEDGLPLNETNYEKYKAKYFRYNWPGWPRAMLNFSSVNDFEKQALASKKTCGNCWWFKACQQDYPTYNIQSDSKICKSYRASYRTPPKNHKVVEISCSTVDAKPMYDITVDKWENFAIKVGDKETVIVHNSAIYGAMVGMVNDRYGTVDGEGNFGDSMGSGAAAMRYTECRLAELSMRMFDCIEVADWVENYSGRLQEPLILPSRLPLLLMNGTDGIAVGLSSRIPSHNLGELIGALKAVLKKGSKATVDDILKYINGPDYFGGVLLSTPEEIREVYNQGWGTLKFKCTYHIEEIDGDNVFVIDSIPPYFNPYTFMTNAGALADEGLIKSVSDESNEANPIRITIEFNNPAVITSRILPLLNSTVSYSLYVTERIGTGDVKVKFITFLQLMQEWLDYRRIIEEKLLKLELSKLETRLEREEARLWVMKDVDGVVKIVKNAIDYTDLLQKLMRYLEISEQAADYIANLPLRSLMKVDIPGQEQKISETKTEIKTIKTKLEDIDSVILEQLNELAQYSDDRRTKLLADFQEPDMAVEGGTFYVSASAAGNMVKSQKINLKGKGWSWDHFAEVQAGVTTVTNTGLAGQWGTGFLVDGKTGYDSIIGLIPYEKEVLVVLDDLGYGIALEHPQNIDEYQTIKTEGKVIAAVGLSKGDTLFCWDGHYDVATTYGVDDLYIKRRNSYGYLLVPKRTKGVQMMAVAKGCQLVSVKDGSIVSYNEALKVDVISVCKNNFVIYNDGAKAILTRGDVISDIKKIWKCFPVSEV